MCGYWEIGIGKYSNNNWEVALMIDDDDLIDNGMVRVSSMLDFFFLKCDILKIAKQRNEISNVIPHTC